MVNISVRTKASGGLLLRDFSEREIRNKSPQKKLC